MGGFILEKLCRSKASIEQCDRYILGIIDALANDKIGGSSACIPQEGIKSTANARNSARVVGKAPRSERLQRRWIGCESVVGRHSPASGRIRRSRASKFVVLAIGSDLGQV